MHNAMLAGFVIGLSALLSCSINNAYLAALVFSVGLLFIRIEKLPLFTGQIQKLPMKEITIKSLFKILFQNICGVCGAMILAFGISFHHKIMVDNYIAIADTKWLSPWWYYILTGFVCGFLMTIATRPSTPLWVSCLCVASFILGKFNHCIADWFYISIKHFPSWICVVVGNMIGGVIAVPIVKSKGISTRVPVHISNR